MQYSTLDTLFERFHYPAGESHLRLRADCVPEPGAEPLIVEARVTNFEQLGQVLTADRLLQRLRVPVRWFLPYFPFARHDRRLDARDGFELEIALELVSGLDLTIADPHSDVTGMLRHIPQRSVVEGFRHAGALDNDPLVVVPDLGASKKVSTWLAGADVVQATKQRDPRTGELSGFAIQTGAIQTGTARAGTVQTDDLGGRPCLIVDDLCDGGGTFLGLAEVLRHHHAGPLTLAVTHGLFTRGLEALHQRFARIFTCTYADQPAPEGVVGVPFKTLFEQGVHQ